MKTSAIVLCGGRSRRMDGQDKLFAVLGEDPLFMHAVRAFTQCPLVNEVVVVFHSSNMQKAREELAKYNYLKPVKLVLGGDERYISAQCGLLAVEAGTELVLVHDGARPLITQEIIKKVWMGAKEHGACVAAVPVKDTIKESLNGQTVDKTLCRADLLTAQTPQGFQKSVLDQAYKINDRCITDDAQMAEKAGFTVHITEGDEYNLKVTNPCDFLIIRAVYEERTKE